MRLGNVGAPVSIYNQPCHRVLNAQVVNVPVPMQKGTDCDLCADGIGLQQRWVGVRRSAMDDHSIKMNVRERQGVKERLAHRLAGFLLRRLQNIRVKSLTAQQ